MRWIINKAKLKKKTTAFIKASSNLLYFISNLQENTTILYSIEPYPQIVWHSVLFSEKEVTALMMTFFFIIFLFVKKKERKQATTSK